MYLRRHADLSPPMAGDVVVNASVGPDHEVVALWSTRAGADRLHARRTNEGGASFAETEVRDPPVGRITVHRPQGELVAEIAALDIALPTVQPMPNERYLILGGRCRRTTDGVEKNGSVVDNTGRELVRATVGDGIQHALATPTGRVWLGFFDEGVYGNFGWGFDGAEPLGTHGLVRVGPKLTPEWSFPFDQGLAPVDDCYALNVDGETAWACYYSGFPVVRIEEGSIHTWRNDVTGARALITDGRQLALIGGYGEDRNRVVYGELHDEHFAPRSIHELVLPDGAPLASATMVGRGPSLHVLTDSVWYQLSLDDAATA